MEDRPNPTAADPSSPAAAVPESESEFTYFRIVDPVTPDAYLKGVVRERVVDGYSDSQVFTRSQGWKDTIMPTSYRRGLLENDLVEITPATARALIDELRALWRR